MKFAGVFATLAVADAGTVAVTWSDCGAQHATVTDLQPLSVALGSTQTLTGTGQVDEEVTSGFLTATAYASGVKIVTCSGDGTADIVCKLPLGAGQIAVKALDFPIAAGTVTIEAELTTSSLLPSSLAKTHTEVRATEQNGEDLICLNLDTQKSTALEAKDIDCTTAVCQDQCTCSLDKCASEISACLGDSACAASQDCALSCPCSDNACMLTCAAKSPSIKALPVASCVNSKCASTKLEAKDIDCSTAVCQDQCACSLDKCASEISACLGDSACAASQDCALSCPCSDNACMLTCAAKSPSIKALPVASCVNSKCASTLV